MEFDKSIKTNNVKFEFVKENSDKKEKKTKNNKTGNPGKPGTEGFESEEGEFLQKGFFQFKLTELNIFTFIILSVLVPVIGINGILLFHRYASFKPYDWNGIAQNEQDDDKGIWYASNIYNDKVDDLKFENNDKKEYYTDSIPGSKNYYATNKNKHKDKLFNALDPGIVIKNKYQGESPSKDTWGINYGFTSIISSTFDTYRDLIKQLMENSNVNENEANKKYQSYNQSLAANLQDNKSNNTPDGGDKLGKYFFTSLVYFVIGLILSFLAPVMSFIYGIKSYFTNESGVNFINAYIVGKPIGIILAHIMSCFTPLIFLYYTLIFPLFGTKESPSYLNKFLCILKDSTSSIPFIVMLNFLFLSTALIALKTSIGVVPGILGGGINILLILYFGVLKFHDTINKV
jgi:hypothetical protein